MNEVHSASALRTLLALCFLCDAWSTVFYVDPINGLDSHDGQTLSSAFQSVQRCVDALHGASAGSECRLRAGQYRSGAYVLVEHLHGQLGNPYVIGKYAADEGEVVFEGTVDVHANCSAAGGLWEEVSADFGNGGAGADHWATTMPEGVEPWQVFVGRWDREGEPFVNARWPDGAYNGRWDDKSIFYARAWKHGSHEKHGSRLRGERRTQRMRRRRFRRRHCRRTTRCERNHLAVRPHIPRAHAAANGSEDECPAAFAQPGSELDNSSQRTCAARSCTYVPDFYPRVIRR